jgi:hypothetical protein
MSQYHDYQITVTNGSPNVLGVGATKFLANAAQGDLLFVNGVIYQLGANPTDDTHFALSSNYAGVTGTYDYVIHRGFTPVWGIPYPDPNDIDAHLIVKRAALRIEELIGKWIDVAFSAGNFTASGAMTWTVDSGDVLAFGYAIHGDMMTVGFSLQNTTVGGTLGNILKVAIPASKTPKRYALNPILIVDNGVATTGYAQAVPATGQLSILRTAGGNYSAATNTTSVYGEITFPIN